VHLKIVTHTHTHTHHFDESACASADVNNPTWDCDFVTRIKSIYLIFYSKRKR